MQKQPIPQWLHSAWRWTGTGGYSASSTLFWVTESKDMRLFAVVSNVRVYYSLTWNSRTSVTIHMEETTTLKETRPEVSIYSAFLSVSDNSKLEWTHDSFTRLKLIYCPHSRRLSTQHHLQQCGTLGSLILSLKPKIKKQKSKRSNPQPEDYNLKPRLSSQNHTKPKP